jgi:hypothetical protein
MYAEAAWSRHWIDEAREGRASAQGKVIALGEMQRRDPIGWRAGNRARERLRAETGGVYDRIGVDLQGAGPPVSMMSPRSRVRPTRTGVSNANIAPWASASPRNASMKAWLSMMLVEGESNARSATSAGSSARASLLVSQMRSVTPLASAYALSAASLSISPAFTAAKSFPHRLCGTPNSRQNAYSIALPSTQRRVLSSPVR